MRTIHQGTSVVKGDQGERVLQSRVEKSQMGSWKHLYKMGHEIKDRLKVRMKK